jgi:hypothetical protein
MFEAAASPYLVTDDGKFRVKILEGLYDGV